MKDKKTLLEECLKEMRRMKDKKTLFYGQLWPHGIGRDDFVLYAFSSEKKREEWLQEYQYEEAIGDPSACIVNYEDMQKAYGNNFLEGVDGKVCLRPKAGELHCIIGVLYF